MIPENVQKKTARDAKVLKVFTEARQKAKTDRVEKRKILTANAEKYLKANLATAQANIDSRRKAKAEGNIFVEAEPKIVFVIRTRG